jgi:tRNA nucleotidyltransferase (CCA-adding enzyme)
VRIYLVGGAVRDSLLQIPFSERDWVVVGATEQQMLDRGFRRADARFPVFLHPETGEEYALARRETKTGPGYKGFSVDTSPRVTLEQDLARRDLTINAMAQDDAGRLIDPYGGRDDLDAGRLRHVTPAFVEDPVRLLRIARFAAKLGQWGFRVAHSTHKLLTQMAASEDFAHLRPERVWREMKRGLAEPQPWRFFEVLQRCGALARLIPELDLGRAPEGHADAGAPGSVSPLAPIPALQRSVAAGAVPEVRFAVLLAAAVGRDGPSVDALCRRLRAERAYCDALAQLIRARSALQTAHRFHPAEQLDFLQRFGGLKKGDGFDRLLLGLTALDPEGSGSAVESLDRARAVAVSISIEDLAHPGLEGAAIGEALRSARIERIEQELTPPPGRQADPDENQ